MTENFFARDFGSMERTAFSAGEKELTDEQQTDFIHRLIEDALVGGVAGFVVGRTPLAGAIGAAGGAYFSVMRAGTAASFHDNGRGPLGSIILEDTMAGGAVGLGMGDGIRGMAIGAGIGLGTGLVDQLVITPLFTKH